MLVSFPLEQHLPPFREPRLQVHTLRVHFLHNLLAMASPTQILRLDHLPSAFPYLSHSPARLADLLSLHPHPSHVPVLYDKPLPMASPASVHFRASFAPARSTVLHSVVPNIEGFPVKQIFQLHLHFHHHRLHLHLLRLPLALAAKRASLSPEHVEEVVEPSSEVLAPEVRACAPESLVRVVVDSAHAELVEGLSLLVVVEDLGLGSCYLVGLLDFFELVWVSSFVRVVLQCGLFVRSLDVLFGGGLVDAEELVWVVVCSQGE